MRCHRGFWVYAGEHGEDISHAAACTAREQAALDEPGCNKIAEDWLRSRAGRALRSKWLAESPAECQRYMASNADVNFQVTENPTGIADLRRDRRRYPRMIRADVTTPQVLEQAVPNAPALTASNRQTQNHVNTFEDHRGELMRAAFTAELASLGYACRQGDVDRVVGRSAALVECLGARLVSELPPSYQSRVVDITREVARQMRAAMTQMRMHTDTEADAAISETRASVANADKVLCSYVRDAITKNENFAAMYNQRENYRAVGAKYLRHFYLLGGISATPSTKQAEKNLTADTGTGSDDPIETSPTVTQSLTTLVDLAAIASSAEDTSDVEPTQPTENKTLTPPTLTTSLSKRRRECGDNDNDNSDSDYEVSSEGSQVECSNMDKSDQEAPHPFFRVRVPRNTLLFQWEDSAYPGENRVVYIYQDDLDSLLPGGLLSASVLDYFIFRHIPRQKGMICACGTGMYLSMDVAKYSRYPKKKKRLYQDVQEQFDWTAFKYVLLPVSGRNHWSFLVVENPMNENPTKVYHVNSLRKAHDSSYAFDVLYAFLDKVHKSKFGSESGIEWSTFVHNTKPQQANSVDCGLYLLHYMTTISQAIAAEAPVSIEDMMAKWVSGGLNVTKAEAYRSQLYSHISSL